MALTAGVSTVEKVSSDVVQITATAATDATGAVTYQWHRSVTSGFTPSAATELSGQTELTLVDENIIPNTTFYYVLAATDEAPATVTYTQVSAAVGARASSPNQFDQRSVAGMKGLQGQADRVISVQIDEAFVGEIREGEAVKLSANTGEGVPKVELADGDTDEVFGYVVYANKQSTYKAGEYAEIAMEGVRYLFAGDQIDAGKKVVHDTAIRGTVLEASAGGSRVVGYALDKANAQGELFRVMLKLPSFELDA